MKFLTIATRRQQLPVPPEALPAIFAAQREWISDRVADGTIDVIYGFPVGGGVAITNAESGEELNAILLSSPGFMLLDWDVRPLADVDTVLANSIESFQRMAVGALT